MEILTIEYLESLFSKPRIDAYLDKNDTPEMVLAKYHRNIMLSEAMVPMLHYFEILLRNRVDKVIRKYYGENWLLKNPSILKISDKDINKVSEIISKIKREGRSEVSHDTILAQMTFGFWCAFFHKKYDPVLWHRKHALKDVFPYLPKHKRTRAYVEHKILKIKVIRNRIAHHEPIWNHKISVTEIHAICCELIEAFSPQALNLLLKIDRFPEVQLLNDLK